MRPRVLGVVPIHSPGLERWDDTTGELPGKVQAAQLIADLARTCPCRPRKLFLFLDL